MKIDMNQKIISAKKKGVSLKDIKLMQIHYRKAKFYRITMGDRCSKCGIKLNKSNILCHSGCRWLCIACYDKMFLVVD
jgi:hypothetical protein